ncbi:hypothetical protein D9V65_01550 [Buchnera aphidicola (Anoecia oenotherae)]|uniref:Uncharacterized protein n=1 Tax=Buchnera aphidicola (Anoecia oenotherae) TaxID=1241833 RepID=A0A4D6XQZ0_9GAMM|nr:hypothetical protein D9V65_01550 [Buchnera aphidicola (Anoecia oenotherae)]
MYSYKNTYFLLVIIINLKNVLTLQVFSIFKGLLLLINIKIFLYITIKNLLKIFFIIHFL